MKNLLITLGVAMAFSAVAEAGQSKCCKPAQSCSTCSATRWYKAKDGTFREMMPYMKALDRAEDADDMEPVLKQAQADLATANSEIAAAKAELQTVQADAEKLKTDMEAQLAELKKQLEAEKQAVVAQKERADKAEAAHKLCIAEVAELREQGKKQDEALASVKGELKSATEERDSLKTAKVDLEKQVSDLTAAKDAAEEAMKAAQAELEKMKQEAAEAKKAAVEGDAAPQEGDAPDAEGDAGDEKPPEPGTEPAPEPGTEPAPETP